MVSQRPSFDIWNYEVKEHLTENSVVTDMTQFWLMDGVFCTLHCVAILESDLHE